MPEETMRRPQAGEDYVQRRAAEMMLPALKRYLGTDAKNHRDRDLLADLAKYICNGDGYEIVKSMERGEWMGDIELVELMDDAGYTLSRAVEELTKQWVKCARPEMPFAIGDLVSADYYDRKGQVAVVTRIDADVAKYGIRYPDQPATSCYVIEVERLSAAPALEVPRAA